MLSRRWRRLSSTAPPRTSPPCSAARCESISPRYLHTSLEALSSTKAGSPAKGDPASCVVGEMHLSVEEAGGAGEMACSAEGGRDGLQEASERWLLRLPAPYHGEGYPVHLRTILIRSGPKESSRGTRIRRSHRTVAHQRPTGGCRRAPVRSLAPQCVPLGRGRHRRQDGVRELPQLRAQRPVVRIELRRWRVDRQEHEPGRRAALLAVHVRP